MKCPVCQTECVEDSQICIVCAWEFKIYVSDISEQEKKLYQQKLEIAQKNWNELNILKNKIHLKEKQNKNASNTKIIKAQSKQVANKPIVKKTTDLVYSESTKVPKLKRDPFETFEEFQDRIINHPPVPTGKVKLIKEEYSFKIGEFSLEIEWDEWFQNFDELTSDKSNNRKNNKSLKEEKFCLHGPPKEEKFCLHVPPNISKELYQSNQLYTLFIKLTFKDDAPVLDTIELFWKNQAFPVELAKGLMKPLANESQKDYKERIISYNDIVVGECSLIKEKYDIESGKFPLKIKKDQWLNNICNSEIYYPYIIVNREIARKLYEKSKIYPIKASFKMDDHKVPSIDKYFIDVKNGAFLIENSPSLIESEDNNRDQKLIEPLTGMELVYVPGGRFMMGDLFGYDIKNAKPVHEVKLDGFYIGKYPVTQGQWKRIMKNNPSKFKKMFKKSNNYPVENILWNDAQEFIKKINSLNKNKYTFRLPTEAEWEYAARSCGKKEMYAGGDNIDELAWYWNNSNKTTHQVGEKKPNALGLFDLSGNVWEWCEDIYDDKVYNKQSIENPVFLEGKSGSRVLRGGSWGDDAKRCRVAYRNGFEPDSRSDRVGYRLVCSPRSENSDSNKRIKIFITN